MDSDTDDLLKLHRATSARFWIDSAETVFVEVGQFPAGYQLKRIDRRKPMSRIVSAHELVTDHRETRPTIATDYHPPTGRFAVSLDAANGGKPGLVLWTCGEKPTRVETTPRLSIQGVAFSPDGKLVAAGFPDGSAAWYDATTGKPVRTLQPFAQFTTAAVAFHPSGKFLACGTYGSRGQQNVFLIDIRTGDVVSKFSADLQGVSAVCFNPSGTRLAAFGGSGTITIWDATALLKLEGE